MKSALQQARDMKNQQPQQNGVNPYLAILSGINPQFIIGGIINSLKGITFGPPSNMQGGLTPDQQNQWALKALIQNTIDQTAYTPQAQAYINSLPINYYNKPTTYTPAQPPLPDTALGVENGNTGIVLKGSLLGNDTPLPVEVLRHELIHSLDANANSNQPASFIRQGKNTGDSMWFGGKMTNNNAIQSFLQSYKQPGEATLNPDTRDIESFAQFGSQGQSALLNPNTFSDYSGIYQPISKALNYSPVYPDTNYFNNYNIQGALQ